MCTLHLGQDCSIGSGRLVRSVSNDHALIVNAHGTATLLGAVDAGRVAEGVTGIPARHLKVEITL